MTGTRFLHRTFSPCRRTRRPPREITHEDCFDFCALPAGADVYGLWAERVPSLYPPAATGESRGSPVPYRRQHITVCRILLRAAAAWRTSATLWLFRATCADSVGGGALQHPCVSPDDGAGEHYSGSGGLCTVGTGFPSVPRKLQGHLQHEACDAAMNCVAAFVPIHRKGFVTDPIAGTGYRIPCCLACYTVGTVGS